MRNRSSQSFANRRGIALILTLILLVLATILVTALATMMTTERSAARGGLNNEKSHQMNTMAQDHAIALLRDGIAAAESTYAGVSANRKFWAFQPGKITVFNSDGTVDTSSSKNLYSIAGTDASLGNPVPVDINQATFSGNNPIASGSPAPAMPVQWINVFKNPNSTASAANSVVGRYAFWVDDESAKVNINTADGTSKYVDPNCYAAATPSAPVSFGAGMPTEVNLDGLKVGSANLDTTSPPTYAMQISSLSGVRSGFANPRSFNSSPEILLASPPSSTYQDNNFSLTTRSRSPELNIFGEPRIYLLNTAPTAASSTILNAMTGPYLSPVGANGIYGSIPPPGLPLTQVYPSSNPYAYANGNWVSSSASPNTGNQLPAFAISPTLATLPNSPPSTMALPQYFLNEFFYVAYPLFSPDYLMGWRIAQYLKGYNSQGQPITWPTFPGSGNTGFAGKYTDRQIDSITMQILDLIKKTPFADNYDSHTNPYVGPGWLSGQLVRGVGRGPHICQVLMTFSVSGGSPPCLSISTNIQSYFPREYAGYDLTSPYCPDIGTWLFNMNSNDYYRPSYSSSTNPLLDSQLSPPITGDRWGGHLLHILDQNGNPAGVDLNGNDPTKNDPNQTDAALYHSYLAPSAPYPGSGPIPGYNEQALQGGPPALVDWKVGYYHLSQSYDAGALFKMNTTTNKVTISGGVNICMVDGTGTPFEMVPLDAAIGSVSGTITAAQRPTVLSAVIPIPAGTTISQFPGQVTVLMKVVDPLVNNFPGDWVCKVNPSASDIASLPTTQVTDNSSYSYQAGALAEFNSQKGGDPSAYWLPELNQNIPKSQRFPSVGYLQYIRTGLMPDKNNDASLTGGAYQSQHGTPFRLLDFAPSTDPSQQTGGGISYPDWAMLDLFTVPASPQALGSSSPINMTFGGSTPGRVNVNLNNSTDTSALFATQRSTPLESVFRAITASNAYTAAGSNLPDTPNQTTVDEKALAQSINTYLSTLQDANGISRPLMMPAEIANVPGVSAYLYQNPGFPARESRNDLLRQTIGNLTTQSNTFSVWTMGQAIQKHLGSIDYGTVDGNDTILSQSRMHYIVERYIDQGTDGIPGNANNPGVGGPGVPNDLVDGDDTQSPLIAGANPKMTYPLPYKYRVVYSEEIAN